MIRDWFRENFQHYRISTTLNEINETEKTEVFVSQFMGRMRITITNEMTEHGWVTKKNITLFTEYGDLNVGDVIVDAYSQEFQVQEILPIKDNFGVVNYYKVVLNEYRS